MKPIRSPYEILKRAWFLFLLPAHLFAAQIVTSRTIDTIGSGGECDTLAVTIKLQAPGNYDTTYKYDTVVTRRSVPIDAVMLLDNSSSMGSGAGSKLEQAKAAALTFATIMGNDTNRIAVYQFNGNVTDRALWKLCPFVKDTATVRGAIRGLKMEAGTPLYEAIILGADYAKANRDSTHTPVIVLMTDGVNYGGTPTEPGPAYSALSQAWASDSVRFFSIGFGTEAMDTAILRRMADTADGSFFYAPDSAKLDSAYRSICRTISNQRIDSAINRTPIPVKPDTVVPPVDLALVLDNTSSMGSGAGSKHEGSKAAAAIFASQFLGTDTASRVAVYQFNGSIDTSKWLLVPLTSDTHAVYDTLRNLGSGAGTPLYDATMKGLTYLKDHYDTTHTPVLTVLTDGQENQSKSTKAQVLAAVTAAWNNQGVRTFMIGFGSRTDVDSATMTAFATAGGGSYFFAPDSATLVSVYKEIAQMVLTNIAAKSVVIEQPLPAGMTLVAGSVGTGDSNNVEVTFSTQAGTPPKLVWTAKWVPVWSTMEAACKVVACGIAKPDSVLYTSIKYKDDGGKSLTATIGTLPPVMAQQAAGPSRQPCLVSVEGRKGELVIAYTLPGKQRVRLAVFSASGRLVAGLADGMQTAGRHVVRWRTPAQGAGVYVVRLSTAGRSVAKAVTVTARTR